MPNSDCNQAGPACSIRRLFHSCFVAAVLAAFAWPSLAQAQDDDTRQVSTNHPTTEARTVTFRPVANRARDAVSPRKSNQASKRDIGSARQLRGSTVVQHVFLSDRHSSWTNFEKQRVKKKVKEAYDFVSLHARRFNENIKFVDEYAKDIKLTGRIPLDAHADPRWTEYAIGLGQDGTAVNAVARIKQKQNPDNVIICLHVNKPALSYNLAYYKNVTRSYEAERMVCFTSYPDGRETSSATYAHEILHLFGAGDLYFPYDRTENRKNDASRMFPNDIMFRVDYDIYQLNVGAFTAYRVGWKDSLPDRYAHLED